MLSGRPCCFPPPAYTALNSALRDARVGMGEARPPLDNLDRSLEEPAGSASKLEQLEVLVAVLVLVLVALLCVWLWRLRRWWREQRERHVKVLDEIEMCEPASEPSGPLFPVLAQTDEPVLQPPSVRGRPQRYPGLLWQGVCGRP